MVFYCDSDQPVASMCIYLPKLGGGNSNIYVVFTPNIGEDSHFDDHFFQLGWFNHQPVNVGKRYMGWYGQGIHHHQSLAFGHQRINGWGVAVHLWLLWYPGCWCQWHSNPWSYLGQKRGFVERFWEGGNSAEVVCAKIGKIFHLQSSFKRSIFQAAILSLGGETSKIFYFYPENWRNDPIWQSYFLRWIETTK